MCSACQGRGRGGRARECQLHGKALRGDGAANWIGLLVVVQNIFTSLFNSHIFDFHEGWMYVLGVGVAGGMVLKAQLAKLATQGS